MRRAEQTEAAKHVGVTDLVFLGQPDGQVVVSLELRREIAKVIRQVRPTVVITQSPVHQPRSDLRHPPRSPGDRRGDALDAIYPDARNPFAFPELLADGLEPWKVAEAWVFGDAGAGDAVDITDRLDRKMQALLAHRSQHPDPDGMERASASWGGAIAARFGLGEGRPPRCSASSTPR